MGFLGLVACSPASDLESHGVVDELPFAEDAGFVAKPRECSDARPCRCAPVAFTIDTKQSCAISTLPGYTMDGEGFIAIGGKDYRVFAINRWGAGHIIGWCDTTTLIPLLGAFDVTGYLGQTQAPRVASMGYTYLCDQGVEVGKVPATYLGEGLPQRYVDSPGALAAEWDVLIFCGYKTAWNPAWRRPIQEFVSTSGKGLLAAMDYEGLVSADDFAQMSELTKPSGIAFDPLNLPWAPASTTVALDCVPDALPVH